MLALARRIPALQFVRFFGVSLAVFFVDYGLRFALTLGLGWNAVASAAVGYGLGGLASYGLNRLHVFETDRSHVEAAGRFFAVVLLGIALTSAVMAALSGPIGLPYVAAWVLTTGLVFLCNFWLHRSWTFAVA